MSFFSDAEIHKVEHFKVVPTDAPVKHDSSDETFTHDDCEALVDALIEHIDTATAAATAATVAAEEENAEVVAAPEKEQVETEVVATTIDEMLPLSKKYSPEEVRAFFENLKV